MSIPNQVGIRLTTLASQGEDFTRNPKHVTSTLLLKKEIVSQKPFFNNENLVNLLY